MTSLRNRSGTPIEYVLLPRIAYWATRLTIPYECPVTLEHSFSQEKEKGSLSALKVILWGIFQGLGLSGLFLARKSTQREQKRSGGEPFWLAYMAEVDGRVPANEYTWHFVRRHAGALHEVLSFTWQKQALHVTS